MSSTKGLFLLFQKINAPVPALSYIDELDKVFNVLISGLVVSGNNYIVVQRQVVSGDTMSNQRVSGYTDWIMIRPIRIDVLPLRAGYAEMVEYFDIDVYNIQRQSQVSGLGVLSGASSTVRQRVNDIKITIASGSYSGISPPTIVGENWAQPHQQVTKATLSYRTRYML